MLAKITYQLSSFSFYFVWRGEKQERLVTFVFNNEYDKFFNDGDDNTIPNEVNEMMKIFNSELVVNDISPH